MRISYPKILWPVKRKVLKRTFVTTLDRISAVYLNETCASVRQTDRLTVYSVRASLAYIYIITFGTRRWAPYISSGLFVWPEILRFGMAGCHGMMSW